MKTCRIKSISILVVLAALTGISCKTNEAQRKIDALAILNQVRETYRVLEGYHFEHKIVTEVLNTAGETVELNEKTLVTATDLATPPRGGKPGLSFNKKRFRMEMRKDGDEILLVCNEHAAWRYQSADNLYSKGRSMGDLIKALWAAMYLGSHMTPFFIVAEEDIQDAEIIREEVMEIGGEQRDCYVIEASLKPDADKKNAPYSTFGYRFPQKPTSKSPPNKEAPTRTTLWIDKERSVIAHRTATATRMINKSQKDSEEKLPGEEVRCKLTDTFTIIRLGSPLPDELFSFTPPADAKETTNQDVLRHRRHKERETTNEQVETP